MDALLFHDEALKAVEGGSGGAARLGGRCGARIDVATFKERFGVSRKFAIPLLEYLDRERVTRRTGETAWCCDATMTPCGSVVLVVLVGLQPFLEIL